MINRNLRHSNQFTLKTERLEASIKDAP